MRTVLPQTTGQKATNFVNSESDLGSGMPPAAARATWRDRSQGITRERPVTELPAGAAGAQDSAQDPTLNSPSVSRAERNETSSRTDILC